MISPGRWPGNYRSAFIVTVEFDADLRIRALIPDAAERTKSLSVGQYGATRGVTRLLGTLERSHIRATWFIPSENLERQQLHCAAIVRAGHDLGNMGVALEDLSRLDLSEQLHLIDTAQAAFRRGTGRAPIAFRSARGSYAPGLPAALVARGFAWSSSWRGDDLPHFHAGVARSLVELPIHYELDDYGYFVFNLDPPIPAGSARIASTREVLGNWKTEFAAYRDEGLCFVLTLHPELIAAPGRIAMLREFFDYIRSFDDVWVATGGEVASWWTKTAPPNLPGHPVEVFDRVRDGELERHRSTGA